MELHSSLHITPMFFLQLEIMSSGRHFLLLLNFWNVIDLNLKAVCLFCVRIPMNHCGTIGIAVSCDQ